MWRVYRRTRKDEGYTNYKEAFNAAMTEIRQSKRRYEQQLVCNINNDICVLDDNITSKVMEFVDDTDGDRQHFQNDDLDNLVKWSEKWQMLFNFGKCKCLHVNVDVNFKMGYTVLGTVKENDLRVTISADMKVSEHCCIAVSNGNAIFGLIRRNIQGKQLIKSLYKATVRPHLEYCMQACRPYRKKDIIIIYA